MILTMNKTILQKYMFMNSILNIVCSISFPNTKRPFTCNDNIGQHTVDFIFEPLLMRKLKLGFVKGIIQSSFISFVVDLLKRIIVEF